MKAANISGAWHIVMAAIALIFTSCDEDTGSLGVYPQQDAISTSTASFGVLSADLINDVVPAGSTTCYLGKVIDPETDQAVTATFAAQFHTFENYAFPKRENIITDDGLLCDSIEIRLFIRNTFGDKNNPMKLEVWSLSADDDKLLKENTNLYTNTDLWQFVDEGKGLVTSKVFTATDYIMSEDQRASNTYSDNVRIVLPREAGNSIMEAYYSNPAFFRDSYSFIRNVCPGYLFRTVSGTGTMLNIEVSTMNLNFRYKSDLYPDSVISALCRFAATPEVIQSTQFESSNLASLVDNEGYTMLKTPAGICTELTLPIDDIYKGHENDSITRASFTLMRINNGEDAQGDYALGIPQILLLVRKQDLESFFAEHQVSDSQQSFTTRFVPTYNSYTFDNVSRLISYCQHEKQASMEAELEEYKKECKDQFMLEHGLTELNTPWQEEFEKTWAETYEPQWSDAWNAKHPDWNRVVLVPVTVSTTTDTYGTTSQVSVNQDLSLCSTKLVRGTAANPIKMQVIYSRFSGK